MIREKFGELREDNPNQMFIQSMKERIQIEEKNFNIKNNKEEEKEFCKLWEVYYYLYYGLYSQAWKAINNLKEKYRWLIPSDVYYPLKNIYENSHLYKS